MVVEEDEIHLMHQLVNKYGTFSDVVNAKMPSIVDPSKDNGSVKGEVIVGGSFTIGMIIANSIRLLPVPQALLVLTYLINSVPMNQCAKLSV